jgi:hypothetical protein
MSPDFVSVSFGVALRVCAGAAMRMSQSQLPRMPRGACHCSRRADIFLYARSHRRRRSSSIREHAILFAGSLSRISASALFTSVACGHVHRRAVRGRPPAAASGCWRVGAPRPDGCRFQRRTGLWRSNLGVPKYFLQRYDRFRVANCALGYAAPLPGSGAGAFSHPFTPRQP